MELIYPKESYAIVGACLRVYREMGCGFLEAVYQECLEVELTECGVPFRARPALGVRFRGRPLHQTYSPDFICFDRIIVELKAVSAVAREHEAQAYNYLKVARLRLGILVNFGHYPGVQIVRMVAQHGRYAVEGVEPGLGPPPAPESSGNAHR